MIRIHFRTDMGNPKDLVDIKNPWLDSLTKMLKFLISKQRSKTYLRTCAGIICDSGAASMSDCHVFVDAGITNPKSKYHSVKTDHKM